MDQITQFEDTNDVFFICRLGGWSVGGDDATGMTSTVWFNNKGWHSLPSFYNGLSNMMLRANMRATGQADWDSIENYGKMPI